MNVVLFILFGIIAGWVSGRIMKGRGFGLIGNLVVGSIGALIGGFMFNKLNVITSGIFGPLITAIFGAVVLLFVLGGFKRSKNIQ
jgi:uncharacterized membrane protein YeaQ/YmgE (transglycosylase-associated protein family)